MYLRERERERDSDSSDITTVSKIIRGSLASGLKLSFLLRSVFHEGNEGNTLGDTQRTDRTERLTDRGRRRSGGGGGEWKNDTRPQTKEDELDGDKEHERWARRWCR